MAKKKALKTRVNESDERTSHFGMYKVEDSDRHVHLDLFPGATGQSALSTVKLESSTLVKEQEGSIEGLDLGTNAELRGQEMTIYTLVTDVSHDTDLTTLDMILKGGVEEYSISLKRTVQSQGDSVGYKITILFFQ